MLDLIRALLSNFTLIAVATSFLVAQVVKIMNYRFLEGKFNLWHFFETGGMPSTHSASVTALTLSVGLTVGWQTPYFTTCLVFALIVMYDATGVRRAAGKQAEILNKVVEDLYAAGKGRVDKLKELLGHEPIEVFAGAGIAVVVTLINYYVYLIK